MENKYVWVVNFTGHYYDSEDNPQIEESMLGIFSNEELAKEYAEVMRLKYKDEDEQNYSRYEYEVCKEELDRKFEK